MGKPTTRPDRSSPTAPRLILYVGKGGVGKTTVAAATAARAAALGRRTLVVSTDIAHSLGDALDCSLGPEPIEVATNLYAQEVNVLEEVRQSWGKVQNHMSEFLRREGMTDIQADELAVMPGMDEVAALVQIGRKVRSGEFDCIIVDSAPTGETIRLLSTPEVFQSYASRIYGWRGRILGLVGPFLRGALPDLNVVDVMAQLAHRIQDLRAFLIDPQHCSYRIVVTPDRMVLKEALRAETYLSIFDYPIDAVVMNRVMHPPSTDDSFVRALLAHQTRLVADIRGAFSELPIFEAPLWTEEPNGPAELAKLAGQIFGKTDPTDVLHVGRTQQIETSPRGYILKLPVHSAEVEKLSLMKRGDALYIDLGNVRREITLPSTLAALEPGVARIRQGILEVPFETPAASAGTTKDRA